MNYKSGEPLIKIRYRFFYVIAIIALLLFHSTIANAEAMPISLTPYQELLNANQLAVYNQVYQKATTYDASIFHACAPVTEAQLEETMTCFYGDHPELFWLQTAYRYGVNSSGVITKIQLKYGISMENIEQSKIIYDTQINRIVALTEGIDDPIEKERIIHDSICGMNTYTPDCELSQSAYSALTSGSTVCAGYARAFQLACIKAGIPCYYMMGQSKGESHAWNVVYIGGQYYNVDLTWDDSIGEIRGMNTYVYFNKTDAEFATDHVKSPLSARIAFQ